MSTPGIAVFARFKAKSGSEEAVRHALTDMIEPTLQENANIGYALHVASDDPTLFLLYEQWQDQAGLDHHMQQPHFTELVKKLDGTLETPLEVITAHMTGGATAPSAAGTT